MAAMSSHWFCPGLPWKMPAGLLSAFSSASLKTWKFRAFPSASASPSTLATASPLNTCSARQTRLSTMKNAVSRAVPWSPNLPSELLRPALPRGVPSTLGRGFTSSLRGFPGLRVVVALPIKRRHFCAHTSEVRRELAAMMNRVVQAHHHESYGRPLHHSAKIHDLDQLLAGNFRQRFVILCEPLLIPGRNFRRCLHIVRNHRRVGVEHAVDSGLDKSVVRRRDVARQFDRAPRNRVGAVLRLVGGNRFENFLRRAALVFQRSHVHVLQQEYSLICRHRFSHLCPPECVWCPLWARGGHRAYPGLLCQVGCAKKVFVAREMQGCTGDARRARTCRVSRIGGRQFRLGDNFRFARHPPAIVRRRWRTLRSGRHLSGNRRVYQGQ